MTFSLPEFEPVDLMTLDRNLEDMILREYAGQIFEDQHEVIELKNRERIYVFYNLDRNRLGDVLEKYSGSFDYWILDSEPIEESGAEKERGEEESKK